MMSKSKYMLPQKRISIPSELVPVEKSRIEFYDEIEEFEFLLGIPSPKFDSSVSDSELFKTEKERRQYEVDTFAVMAYLKKGQPIPNDILRRVLRVKKRREQLESKKKK